MKSVLRIAVILIALLTCSESYSQDQVYLKVHFLYGSKPKKQYKDTEHKWFGGKLGGHVGTEIDSNRVIDFMRNGKPHLFPSQANKRSRYVERSVHSFYSTFGGDPETKKLAIVRIPITTRQKEQYDSLVSVYLKETPYDYAVFGMRCGAAAYDVLAQVGVVRKYSLAKTSRRIFYPRRLRKRILKKASENNWLVTRQEGTSRRKWERD